ncbi:alpha/beta fold hydrolase [Isoptericola aurantiacus]|uniref:alpha/beta fold hydrolase n=1 Tax=Isoptericola aurantiacus TaxID=3377839 RepID=UPI00383B7FE9
MRVGEVDLETTVLGTGEPVLWLPTALAADELLPVARRVVDARPYRSITYRRRGYGSSSPSDHGSIDRDAADAAALLDVLGIARAHVVGVSYSAAIALRLAAEAPDRVATLCLIEPPPAHVPAAGEFRAACADLADDARRVGARAAAERFLERLGGPSWRTDLDQLPGGAEAVLRDAGTFFSADLQALREWEWRDADAPRITCPVRYVGGADSGEWFAQVRRWVLDLLPQADDVIVPGAGHDLALTHPDEVADAVVGLLRRHQVDGD